MSLPSSRGLNYILWALRVRHRNNQRGAGKIKSCQAELKVRASKILRSAKMLTEAHEKLKLKAKAKHTEIGQERSSTGN